MDITYQVLSNKIKEFIILKNKNNIPKELDFIIETDLELAFNNGSICAKDKEKTIFIIEKPYMIDSNNKRNDDIYYKLEKHENHYDIVLKLDTLEKATFPVVIAPIITNKKDEGNTYDTYICEGENISYGNADYLRIGVDNTGSIKKYRGLLKFDLPKIGTGSQVIGAEVVMYAYAKKLL